MGEDGPIGDGDGGQPIIDLDSHGHRSALERRQSGDGPTHCVYQDMSNRIYDISFVADGCWWVAAECTVALLSVVSMDLAVRRDLAPVARSAPGDLARPWGDVTRENAVPLLGLGAN